MRIALLFILLALAPAALLAAEAGAPDLAPPGAGPVPDGLGTNIHFTDPRPGEMAMIAAGGFRWLRMDFAWERTERRKGEYDFSPYDRLVDACRPHAARLLFILDYSNRLYETDRSVRTPEGREAMARWAAAAVAHFKGRGIVWEMWNEPNIPGFWKPEPNAADYVALARAVGEAIRKAAPEEMYIGPGTSGIPFDFLEACFKGGLLEHWSAVSVHPYRQQPPETVEADYRRLRALIAQYAPAGKSVPIYSGEWGYSAAWRSYDADIQGRYLPRQWLTNLAAAVPLSIWYDWHDDGTDAKEAEHNFGTVAHAYHDGREPVYDPKPAYTAASTLTTQLAGLRFSKRVDVGDAQARVMLFSGPAGETRLAAWTTAREPRPTVIPASPGRFRATDHLGRTLDPLIADARDLAVTLTQAPQYLVPEAPNALLRVAAAWEAAPLEVTAAAGPAMVALALANPLPHPLRVTPAGGSAVQIAPGTTAQLVFPAEISRDAAPRPLVLAVDVEGLGRIAQQTVTMPTNPLAVTAMPAGPRAVHVMVENPSGAPLEAVVRGTDAEGLAFAPEPVRMSLARGTLAGRTTLRVAETKADRVRFGVRVESPDGQPIVTVPPAWYTRVGRLEDVTVANIGEHLRTTADGDAAIAGTVTVAPAEAPAGLPEPGLACVRLAYDMAKGWKFARLSPVADAWKKIEGRPRAFAFWLHGDGGGHNLRLRVIDSTGQCFQPTGPDVTWTGWRPVVMPLDGGNVGHWGGADDGVVHWPVRWDTYLLIDKDRGRAGKGEVLMAGPVLVE
jgi:hypothetical protein